MKHLIDSKNLTEKDIKAIFSIADSISQSNNNQNSNVLKGKTVANVFFENSTRTLISFELAAKRLGAHVVNVNINKSSTSKGESIKDTLLTLEAMQIDVFIIRHSENDICKKIKSWLKPETILINAGDGNNQHPTQGLLDCYTISQHKPSFNNIKVTIIGDIINSRVANSLIDTLKILGNSNIHLYGPAILLPNKSESIHISDSFESALDGANIVVMLRIQMERMIQKNIPNLDNYHQHYGLNEKNIKRAKPDCIVMHPGPINREIEISSKIADNASVILNQVKNGVLIRQALLTYLC